jgi:hypothetical protein
MDVVGSHEGGKSRPESLEVIWQNVTDLLVHIAATPSKSSSLHETELVNFFLVFF